MHRTTIMLAVGLLSIAGTAAAQKLSVKPGTAVVYRSVTNSQKTVSMQGNDQTDSAHTEETLGLTVDKIGKSQIEWRFTDTELDDKGKAGVPSVDKCVTDAVGNVLSVTSITAPASADEHGALKMKFGTAKSRIRRMFLPHLAVAKPGDSWNETAEDATANPKMGMNMNATTKYHITFEAVVDTLGTSAARVRYEATSLTLKGNMNAGGMEMKIDGDGTLAGVSYFSMKDGLLLSRADDLEVSVRISTPTMMIPVVQKQSTTLARVDVRGK